MRVTIFRITLSFLVCCSTIIRTGAQTILREDVPGTFSVGASLGISDLWGDVGTKSVADHYLNSQYTKKFYSISGLFGRLSLHPSVAARVNLNYGMLSATDRSNYDKAKKATSFADDAVQRYIRNQDVRTNIWEGSFMVEFMPLRLNPDSRIARRSAQPYIAAGLGYFHFQPMARVGSHYAKIYELNIEGNGAPGMPPIYKLWQMNVPLAVGLRFDIKNHINLGIEYTYRMCSTDYLDGVSNKYVDPAYYDLTLSPSKAALAKVVADKSHEILPGYTNTPGNWRGNPANNDSYSTIAITIYYKINPRRIPWWGEYY